MKEKLTEREKEYIKEKIIEPLVLDLDKVVLFETVQRAEGMLNSTLRRLKYEKEYDGRVVFEKKNDRQYLIHLQGRRKDVEEVVTYTQSLTLPA